MNTPDPVERGAWPVWLALLWVAGLPVFLLHGNRLWATVPLLKADRVTYLAAVAPLLIAVLRNPRALRPIGRIEKAMAVYVTVALFSWATTLASKDAAGIKQDADFLLSCFLMPFTAFLIARNIDWTVDRVRACLWVLVGGVGTYLLLVGAVQYTYDWNFLVPETLQQIHPDRAKGPFDNAVPYGVVTAILLTLAMYLYLESRRRLVTLALVAICLGLVQSIVASKTRAVWVGVPVALALLAVRYRGVRVIAAVLVADLALQVLLAPMLGVDPLGLQQRLTQPEPVYDRVAISATATNMVEHRPLFGFGFGMFTFQDTKADYYRSWGGVSPKWAVYPNNPHNDLLNVLVLMGVVGLIPYLALLWTIWDLLRRQYARWRVAHPAAAELATVVQAVFVVVLVAAQFHSLMYMSYAQVLFFFALGMVAAGAPPIAAAALCTAPTRDTRAPALLVLDPQLGTAPTARDR